MKKYIYSLISLSLFGIMILNSSCGNREDNPADLVSRFVYDGMSSYYLWADEMIDKEPTSKDSDPKSYFQRILNSTDKEHGWSFITDDVQSLLADFAGEPKSFGFSFDFAQLKNTGDILAVIQYLFPNTPASDAGLERLDVIAKIDGEAITQNNYTKLYGSETATFTVGRVVNSVFVQDKEIKLTPRTIATDPVLYTNIYEIGGKKIAYLFYTDFISNYNKSLYKAFSKFKSEGVTDLVLDLRYNHGGAITAATYLSSMIAPKTVVEEKSPFAILSYNNFLNQHFGQSIDSLGVYNSENDQNPLDANLNLNKVYIIATSDSYSASELTAFCLKPYMDVVHIGENTGGKYTASFTLHPYDEGIGVPIYDESKLSTTIKRKFANWAMQPIIAKYTNCRNEDFSTPGHLVPDHFLQEGNWDINNWAQIGDTKDGYLGQAIYMITGDESYKPTYKASVHKVNKVDRETSIKLSNPNDFRKEAVILDNVNFPFIDFKKLIDSVDSKH